MNKPSDICIVLCSFHATHEAGWIDADHVRHRLGRLGWNVTTQQVASWMARIARLDAPPLERQDDWGRWAYRVTPFGETWVHNKLPDIWWAQQYARDRARRQVAA
jgi:hypothetical protein